MKTKTSLIEVACTSLVLSLLMMTSCLLSGASAVASALMQRSQDTIGASGDEIGQLDSLPRLQVARELERPGDTFGVIWSSDGSKLAAYTYAPSPSLLGVQIPSAFGNLLTIWTSDGQLLRELTRPNAFFSVSDTFAFVAGDKQIVTPPGFDESALAFSVFDVDTGRVIHEVPGDHPNRRRNVNAAKTIVASPDQTTIAVTFGMALAQPVALYSTRDWAKTATLPDEPKNITERPDALAFSADGTLLAMARGDGKIFIYDLATRLVMRRIEPFPEIIGPVGAMAFSPDSQSLAVGTRQVEDTHYFRNGEKRTITIRDPIRVFHAKDDSRSTSYTGSQHSIYALSWSPTDNYIAFISVDGKLHLWDPTHSEREERTFGLNPGAMSLAFSPDGRYLAVGNGHVVTVFNCLPIAKGGVP